ncbi:DUF3558 family protein [Allokutzneria sp. NRRL B-24872]|uniref:DUF3558 family protein n=1 Tax=Allokutzneria sp. NRRL B-24872 TaxID=1137961 RepID=UPI000A3C0626|nr:DUF3558 family protein [Allokutzneria sp. NRRL B-24872]
MRGRLWVSLVALTLLTGCGGGGGDQSPSTASSGDSVADFGGKPLAVGTTKPCSMLTAQQAGDLGLVSARSDASGFPREGRPQTPTTCYWADSQGTTFDLQVHKASDAVRTVLREGEKDGKIKGYPTGELEINTKSCRYYLAPADDHYLVFQIVANNKPEGACALGRKAAEVVLGNIPVS